jgi:hypothetical protein
VTAERAAIGKSPAEVEQQPRITSSTSAHHWANAGTTY